MALAATVTTIAQMGEVEESTTTSMPAVTIIHGYQEIETTTEITFQSTTTILTTTIVGQSMMDEPTTEPEFIVQACDPGWHPFMKAHFGSIVKCIRSIHESFANYSDAMDRCADLGGNVLHVDSVAENYFALSIVEPNRDMYGESQPLRGLLIANDYQSSSSESDTSMLWDDYFNSNDGLERCTIVSNVHKHRLLGTWSRKLCTFARGKNGILCQKSPYNIETKSRFDKPRSDKRFEHKGYVYEFLEEQMNFSEAKEACAKRGGSMPGLHLESNEFAFVRYLIQIRPSDGTWIDTSVPRTFSLANYLRYSSHNKVLGSQSTKMDVLCRFEVKTKETDEEEDSPQPEAN